MGARLRYSAVPWLDTRQDLRAFGPPETTVEHGAAVTIGLLVPTPFGHGTTAMLSLTTEDWRHGDVRLAITDVLRFDTGKQKDRAALDLDLLSNPRRKDHPDDNGANDEDDA